MRVLLTSFVIGALALSGCASTHSWYYHDNGQICAEIRSTVVGTGETELVVDNACAILGYATSDTGISNNGKDALGTIAEGIVKGLVPVPVP